MGVTRLFRQAIETWLVSEGKESDKEPNEEPREKGCEIM
jgi:hypothetical protein